VRQRCVSCRCSSVSRPAGMGKYVCGEQSRMIHFQQTAPTCLASLEIISPTTTALGILTTRSPHPETISAAENPLHPSTGKSKFVTNSVSVASCTPWTRATTLARGPQMALDPGFAV